MILPVCTHRIINSSWRWWGAQAHDIDGLKQLTVKTTSGGAPVRVGDIAAVVPATMPVYTAVTADGKPAVLLTLTRQPSGNTVAVADAVAAEIDQLRAKLPQGVKLESFYDQSTLVRESIRSVRDAILIGLVLACLVLFLFLRDWRSSLIAGLVIPVTVAATVLVLWLIGQSFNLMTLGGLAAAIGLVIDDAIVVVENIVLHRDSGENRVDAVRKALHEIARPLVGSTITPVVVFLPLVVVTGVTGSFFRALAITMAVVRCSPPCCLPLRGHPRSLWFYSRSSPNPNRARERRSRNTPSPARCWDEFCPRIAGFCPGFLRGRSGLG